MENIVQALTVAILPLIFALTLPEALRGYAAHRFGDMTGKMAGRLTLNPTKHIDPLGTIFMPLVSLAISAGVGGGGLIFGWAKPVPINYSNVRDVKHNLRWISLASPLANIVMMFGWALIYKILLVLHLNEMFFLSVAMKGVQLNAVLAVFMLIPLPPMPGGMLLFSLLPDRHAYRLLSIEPYTPFILIALFATKLMSVLFLPFARFLLAITSIIFGI